MRKSSLILGTLIAAAIVLPAQAQKAGLPDAIKKLIPAAQKEKELMVWGSTLNPRQTKAINKSFNAFYGTSIEITHKGGRHGAKANEIARAFKNNIPSEVDIFWTAIPKTLTDAKMVVTVDWAGTFGLDKALQMGKGGLQTHHSNSLLVTVNTGLAKPSDYPKKYEDLLSPKWKGKIAIPRSPFPWVLLSYAIGEDKSAALLTKLLKTQNPKKYPRYHNVRAHVLSGEFAIGLGTDAFIQIKKGAPVAHPDMDIMVVNSSGAFIMVTSKSKNAAKLWGYWAVSKEGQATLHEQRGYSLVQTKGTDLNTYAMGRKLYKVPLAWRYKNQGRLLKKFSAIMKGAK